MDEIQGGSYSTGTSTATLRGGRSYAYGRTDDMPRQTELGHDIRESSARRAEADYQRAMQEQREQLAGYLIGENTRTDGAIGAMMTTYGNGGGICEKVCGRVYSPKRTIKQYLAYQDHFRRIGKNQLMKEPGSKTAQFKPRIQSRTFEAQPYGLHAVMTAEDIAEADAGVQVREQNAFALRQILDLEMEYQFFDFATTSANYATGHTAAVSNWDNDLVATIRKNFHTARGVIKTDTGGAPTGNAELVAFGGAGRRVPQAVPSRRPARDFRDGRGPGHGDHLGSGRHEQRVRVAVHNRHLLPLDAEPLGVDHRRHPARRVDHGVHVRSLRPHLPELDRRPRDRRPVRRGRVRAGPG